MITIQPTDIVNSFASPVLFNRTGNIRDKISQCSREELLDYSIYLVCHLEKYQAYSERTNRDLEDILGWNEKL
jgi:hypothetical protein